MKAKYFNKDISLDEKTALYGGSFCNNLDVYDVDKVAYII